MECPTWWGWFELYLVGYLWSLGRRRGLREENERRCQDEQQRNDNSL